MFIDATLHPPFCPRRCYREAEVENLLGGYCVTVPEKLPEQLSEQVSDQPQQRNYVAIAALTLAVVGFVLACTPSAVLVGLIALVIAFFIAIISLCIPGWPKRQGVYALVLSVVGFAVGVVKIMVILEDMMS